MMMMMTLIPINLFYIEGYAENIIIKSRYKDFFFYPETEMTLFYRLPIQYYFHDCCKFIFIIHILSL